MAMLVWVMMGIAVWHFTVFVPDRFYGGIVLAFLVAVVGLGAVRAAGERASASPARTTPAWCRPSSRSPAR